MSAPINLEKGQKIDLTKNSNTHKFYVGLGWNAPVKQGGYDYDLDVSAILLDENGKILNGDSVNFIFYNNLDHPTGAVHHTGDNRTGEGDGDDEVIIVDTSKLPSGCAEVSIIVTIDKATERAQNFGAVKDAFVRLLPANDDNTPGTDASFPPVKYELDEDYSLFTAIQVGSIYRKDLNSTDWKFDAVGQGFKADLGGVLKQYGAQVA